MAKRKTRRRSVAFPATPDLAAQLELWERKTLDNPDSDLWADWIGETHEQWHRRNAELRKKAEDGDHEALARLVGRDPRYLGTEIVQAKILEARIMLWETRNEALAWLEEDDEDARRSREMREAAARTFLRGLSEALRPLTGKGKGRRTVPLSELEALMRSHRRSLKRLWKHSVGSVLLRDVPPAERLSLARDPRVVEELVVASGQPSTDPRVSTACAHPDGVKKLLESPRGAFEEAALAGTAASIGQTPDAVRQRLARGR